MATRKRIRLTDAGIARLRPDAREFTVWDSRVPGLGVRVGQNGGKSYVLIRTVEGRTKRVSLGPVASRRVDDIRHECMAIKVERADDGPGETARAAPSFADFVGGEWRAAHWDRYKPSTRRATEAALRRQLLPAFGSTRLDRITRPGIERWFERYSRTAPGGANWTLGLLRQILNFGIACGHVATNPARDVRNNRRTPMSRFLSREEVRRLHEALDSASRRDPSHRRQADVIRLLLLTGARKGEILNPALVRGGRRHARSRRQRDRPEEGPPEPTGPGGSRPPAARSGAVRVSLYRPDGTAVQRRREPVAQRPPGGGNRGRASPRPQAQLCLLGSHERRPGAGGVAPPWSLQL